MKFAVRYFSVSKLKNTQKIAYAIARAVDEVYASVKAPLEDYVDVLFLGGAVYGGKIAPEVKEFIDSLSSEQVGKVAIFSNSASGKSIYNEVYALLEAKGIAVSENAFKCKGKFLFLNSKHPDKADLDAAADFATSFVK